MKTTLMQFGTILCEVFNRPDIINALDNSVSVTDQSNQLSLKETQENQLGYHACTTFVGFTI